MIVLDLSILNQKGTPMFNSDIFANRPAFGIVGRIFISTDTAQIYRDTGTAWDLIADGGSSSTNIYNSNGTLSGNRVLSDGGFGLSFTPTTHIGTAAIGGGGSGKLIVGSSTADNGIQIFGANSPSIRIDNAQSGGTQRFVIGLATATNNFIQGSTAGNFCISTASAAPLLFGMWQTSNSSEVMRINTTNNLLVGTTTDAGFRLSVVGGNAYYSGNILIGSTNSGADGLGIEPQLNVSFVEGSGQSYVNLFRQLNTAGAVLAQGYKRSLTGGFASSFSAATSKAAIVVGETDGNIAFYSDSATTVPNGTNITPTSKMILSNDGTLLINSFDTTGNRTNPFNVLTLTANNPNAPFDKFGGAILFKNNSYVSGVVNSARIRSFINDGGGLEGGGFIFETTLTAGGTLTPSLTIKYTQVINIANMPTSAVGLVSGDLYRTANVVNIVP